MDSALLPSNHDNLPREAKKTNDSTFDRIYKYFFSTKTRTELTSEEEKISERWEHAWLLLCRHRTRKQVAELIMRKFGVGKSVAYDDVINAMHLWGAPQEDVKHAKRAIAEDAFLKGADKAWKAGDLKMHLEYMKQYSEINKLSEDANNNMVELVKKMRPTKIIIIAKQKELHELADSIQGQLIQDIEHIEIKNEEGKGPTD